MQTCGILEQGHPQSCESVNPALRNHGRSMFGIGRFMSQPSPPVVLFLALHHPPVVAVLRSLHLRAFSKPGLLAFGPPWTGAFQARARAGCGPAATLGSRSAERHAHAPPVASDAAVAVPGLGLKRRNYGSGRGEARFFCTRFA